MNQQKKLIVEVYRNTNLKQLIDLQNVPDGMMMVEGVFGRVDSENRNKRFYERDEYAKHIELMQSRIAESNGILGELEHPKSMNIDLNRVSHKVMEVRLDDDGFVRGRVLLLDTPNGKIAQSIIRSGSPLPISSRAIGKVQENRAVKLDYMSTYDLVGTSGFLEAAVSRKVYESLDSDGGCVSESYAFDLDSNGNVVESTTNDSEYVHVSEINRIVAEQLAAMNITAVNENQGGAGMSEADVIALMNERFANTYSPIIEKWLSTEFAPVLGTSIQEWLINDYSEVVESWIKQDVLTENANLTQEWLTEQFAPVVGNSIQEWLSNDYANATQSWLTEQFAPKIGSSIQEWLSNDYANVLESWITKTTPVVNEHVTEQLVPSTVNEHAELFSTSLLTSIDALINEAQAIDAQVVHKAAQIDEAMYAHAPKWLQGIPADYKLLWQSMNESQKDQIYKRASVRLFESVSDIQRFWKSVNMTDIAASSHVKRSMNINEELDKPFNPRSQLANYAKSLRK